MRDREDYVFFWKPHETNGWASQWATSPFTASITIDGAEEKGSFPTAEHWMMAQKALLFGDTAIAREVLDDVSSNMKYIKALGRQVSNFDDATWKAHREDIVLQGSLHKFRQNGDLRTKLLGTGEKELVEASPRDRIWGIGFGEKNALGASQRQRWGENLLGIALMKARQILREEVEAEVGESVAEAVG